TADTPDFESRFGYSGKSRGDNGGNGVVGKAHHAYFLTNGNMLIFQGDHGTYCLPVIDGEDGIRFIWHIQQMESIPLSPFLGKSRMDNPIIPKENVMGFQGIFI